MAARSLCAWSSADHRGIDRSGLHRVFQVETLNPVQLGCVYLYAFASLPIIQLLKWIRMKLGKSGER